MSRGAEGQRWFWAGVAVIAIVGLALRLDRLDLIPFRYDSAAAYDRARAVFEGGGFPWTGIVNSLGFHNTGALIWFLMPPAAVSRAPETQAAWQGLLWAASIPAFAAVARTMSSSTSLAFVATSAYALLPYGVFAAQGIWAQNILAPLSAISLFFLARGSRQGAANAPGAEAPPAGERAVSLRDVFLSGAFAWFGALVHMCAAPMAMVLTAFVASNRRIGRRVRYMALLPPLLAALASVPSLVDGYRVLNQPRIAGEKPPHIEKFESLQDEAPGVIRRMAAMLSAIPAPVNTFGADGGLHEMFPENRPTPLLDAILAQTVVVQVVLLAGLGIAAMLFFRGGALKAGLLGQGLAALLLAQVLLPPVAMGLFLSRPNPSYLAGSVPALMLLGLWAWDRALGPVKVRWIWPGVALIAFVVLSPGLIYPRIAKTVGLNNDPPWPASGQYYLPLSEHRRVASNLARNGVGPGSIEHVSGEYFALPYRVLVRRLLPPGLEGSRAAVMEDLPLRALLDQGHSKWLGDRLPVRLGPVALRVFDNKSEAEAFISAFRALPPTISAKEAAP